MKAAVNCEGNGDDCFDPNKNPALKREVRPPRTRLGAGELHPARHPVRPPGLYRDGIPGVRHRLGFGGLPHRRRPELQQHRPRHRRFPQGRRDRWRLEPHRPHHDGKVTKTLKARDLWESIGYAAWASADPGIHFHTTINEWHTSPAAGPIVASNPCSEYMFLDDTACNLASVNLLPYRKQDGTLRRRRLRAHLPPLDSRPRGLGDDGAVPLARHRRALASLPHARHRLRQYRRPADDLGHPL